MRQWCLLVVHLEQSTAHVVLVRALLQLSTTKRRHIASIRVVGHIFPLDTWIGNSRGCHTQQDNGSKQANRGGGRHGDGSVGFSRMKVESCETIMFVASGSAVLCCDTKSAIATMPRELVTVQVGQCGNQVRPSCTPLPLLPGCSKLLYHTLLHRRLDGGSGTWLFVSNSRFTTTSHHTASTNQAPPHPLIAPLSATPPLSPSPCSPLPSPAKTCSLMSP